MRGHTSRRLFTKGMVTALAAPLLLSSTQPTTPLSANALSQNSGLRLDTFVRGTDDALWHKWFVDGAWSEWESLGHPSMGNPLPYNQPRVASWGPGRLDLFKARTTDKDSDYKVTLGHRWFDKNQWSDWEILGYTPTLFVV